MPLMAKRYRILALSRSRNGCSHRCVGLQISCLSLLRQSNASQTTGALVLFYLVGNAIVKLSFLFFYRRIFIGRAFSVCTWTAMGATIVWLLYSILAWLLYCGPNLQANFEGGWAVCPAWGFEVQIAVFVVDSVIDLAVLILPIPFVSVPPFHSYILVY